MIFLRTFNNVSVACIRVRVEGGKNVRKKHAQKGNSRVRGGQTSRPTARRNEEENGYRATGKGPNAIVDRTVT